VIGLRKVGLIVLFLFFFALISCTEKSNEHLSQTEKHLKIYWFIPDGMRAEPELFNVYQWAEEGELPNIKKMMEQGSYGYSIPVFPSHTPVNFATLLTGTYPKTNGVADGPMHVENRSLGSVAISGFSSLAKKVDPIWVTAESQGAKVMLISIPGSTPPELDKGITIRGRWGGWGADFAALNFETKGDLNKRILQGRASKLFFLGTELTRYLDPITPANWTVIPKSYSPPKEVVMEGWGATVYGYMYDTSDDDIRNYDTMRFSIDKTNTVAILKQGDWSDWVQINLKWQNLSVDSHIKIKIIKLENDGFFRIRVVYDNLNKFIVDPSYVGEDLEKNIGPLVDFVDNFPPQLVYYPEDKATFLEEMNMSFGWHKKSIPFVIKQYNPDIIIHDIYSPNQMLTSRWWTGYIDPSSKRYNELNETERQVLWKEVKDMYKELDNMIGEILSNNDENTIIVLSSDHGAVPLDKTVNLNNLFAKKGWLKFKINNQTGEPIIDWKNSTVIYLKMDNVYINPEGLAGNWTRGKGPEYDDLREEVKKAILELEDPETKIKPAKMVVEWERVRETLDLPEDRVGDLVIANEAGYGWNEEMSESLKIFETSLITGYKQAILSNKTKGMWTPFIIMGPGVKRGFKIENPVKQVDQYPTIMKLAGYNIPDFVEGDFLEEIKE
jgi:predicted AlkP superfamily phosphohydrolase/phosphomutase